MNVLFLTSTLPRFAGDQQAPFVLEQAAAWKKKHPRDRLIILAPSHADALCSEEVDGVEIVRFRYMRPAQLQTLAYPAILPNIRKNPARAIQLPTFLMAQYHTAKRLVHTLDIDLVYAHWVMPQGLVAHRLKRSTGTPYILQNHSSDLAVFSKFGRPGRYLARAILRHTEALFCVNSLQKDAALALMPGLRCHVLPMGVSLDLAKIAAPVSAESNRFALGTISRLSKKKGIDHLITALEYLAQNGQHFPVGIAGGGEDAQSLAALPKKADITFSGFLSGADKLDFFNDCFAMAFPSVASAGDVEGLPVALLEALAAGKPVIASADTNIALLEEWPKISNHVELLADPSDTIAFATAIERLLKLEPADITLRSNELRRVIGRYRWDRLIEEYLALIREPLTRPEAAPADR